ncbi:MAG: hypothetical protein HY927_05815 [Elusimicrobia bacterium]|nr:hypothetical protein [Elusimicrobiota bacterium]
MPRKGSSARWSAAALLALLAFVPAASGTAPVRESSSQRRYVNGEVRKNGTGLYYINEYSLGVNLFANAFGTSISFNGTPFSGFISGSSSFYSINGGGVSATVNAWSGNYNVNGTVYPQGGGQPLRLSFSMNAMGRTDDPDNPPSYNVYDYASGASLTLYPTYGQGGYGMSGWVEMDKFGSYGTALVGLVATIAIESRPAPKPKAESATPAGRTLAPLPFPL